MTRPEEPFQRAEWRAPDRFLGVDPRRLEQYLTRRAELRALVVFRQLAGLGHSPLATELPEGLEVARFPLLDGRERRARVRAVDRRVQTELVLI